MKLVKKIAVLMSLSLGAVALGGPQDTEISYPEQSFEALPEAGALCDEQSKDTAEHIVFVGGREVIVKEIPASMIEVIDEDGSIGENLRYRLSYLTLDNDLFYKDLII